MISTKDKTEFHMRLMQAIEDNNALAVGLMLDAHDDLLLYHDEFEHPLSLAAKMGSMECIELLVEVYDPRLYNSHALQMATLYDEIECVTFLLPLSDPASFDLCLVRSVEASDNKAFYVFLPLANPKYNRSAALQAASRAQKQDIFDILYPLSNPQDALEAMKDDTWPLHRSEMIEQRMKAEDTHKILHEMIGERRAHSAQRKI